jgi:DNA (cytosine-5)-methyltransferase 1
LKERKPLLVDLCCGVGGCSVGYARAGFDVKGIDINPQPHYPFEFTKANVLDIELPEADCYHISPPCQLFSNATIQYRKKGRLYPDVLTPMRQRLLKTGKPFIIENVIGAPLRKDLILCGEMFGLRVQRHRIFEIHGFTVLQPPHVKHKGSATGINHRYLKSGKQFYYYTVCGHGQSEVDALDNWKKAMGIDWQVTKREISQAIPPAYTEFIGKQIIASIQQITV